MNGMERPLFFSSRPAVMGIINCTPDSFYSGSRKVSVDAVRESAARMIAEGADILDVGGESSRPGAEPVSAETEISRIVPAVEAIREISDIPLSIDTVKASVADAALRAGADVINDISAMRHDSEMIPLAAETGCPVILMHMKGTPGTMQKNPFYENAPAEVLADLRCWTEAALAGGVRGDRIIWDPGIGFGKRLEDNLALLKSLALFKEEGYPLLVGLSRKSMVGAVLDLPPEERLYGTLGADAVAAMGGADILRVHDVRAHVEMIRMMEAILWQS